MSVNNHDYYNVSEIILTYKSKINPNERPQITRSEDCYVLFRKCWDDNKIDFVEEAKLMLLNRANRVLGICNLSSGGVTGTVVDPKLVFAAALKANACQIILAHNHPSENLSPSHADRQITEKLKQAAGYLDITFLDHLIVTRRGYFSFSEDTSFLVPELKTVCAPELF